MAPGQKSGRCGKGYSHVEKDKCSLLISGPVIPGHFFFPLNTMYKENNKITWAREDLPKNKIIEKGRAALSLQELLMILISNGMSSDASYELAKVIAYACNHNVPELARMNANELIKLGLTENKAAIIMAAFELGNRKRSQKSISRDKVAGSRDAFEHIQGNLMDLQYEQFWIILMNRANRIIKSINISEGGVSGTVADPKKIFKMALDNNASSMILAHNHPSGNIQPSEADIRLTRKLKEAGTMLDLPVLDHLILGDDGYFSFADEGMI